MRDDNSPDDTVYRRSLPHQFHRHLKEREVFSAANTSLLSSVYTKQAILLTLHNGQRKVKLKSASWQRKQGRALARPPPTTKSARRPAVSPTPKPFQFVISLRTNILGVLGVLAGEKYEKTSVPSVSLWLILSLRTNILGVLGVLGGKNTKKTSVPSVSLWLIPLTPSPVNLSKRPPIHNFRTTRHPSPLKWGGAGGGVSFTRCPR